MKLASITNGASFNLKRSLFVLLYKQNREGCPQKRDGCVMDKSPFEASVTHVISLEINILSAYFWKIVMGDRCFAKNKYVCSCMLDELAASSLSSTPSSLLRSLPSVSS